MRRAAVGQIVAIHRGDHHMAKAQLLHRRRDIAGLGRIERPGQARLHIAESAGPRAGVAHDHHGGVRLGPAFADIGTGRFLADGMEIVFAHDRAGGGIFAGDRRLDPDPVGLAENLLVGPVRLFGVARGLR